MRADSKSKPEIAEGAEARGSQRDQWFAALTEKIIGAAIEVHRILGPGLLESAYEEALCYELSRSGIRFERQIQLPVRYKGLRLDCGYRIDLVVEDAVIIELKAIDELLPIHSAQLLTYLKASQKQIGLLINFNVPVLKRGLKRMVNHFVETSPVERASAPSALETQRQQGIEARHDYLSRTQRQSPRLSVSAVKEPA